MQYAVPFDAAPHGAARTFMYFDKQATVDEAYAALAWDIAWETVNELSEWTGVGNTVAVAPASMPAARPVQGAAGTADLFTLVGRVGRAANTRTGVYLMARDGIRLVTGARH